MLILLCLLDEISNVGQGLLFPFRYVAYAFEDHIESCDPYEPADAQRKPLTKIFNVQCPHCGVTISITGNTKEATCDHCHRDFLVDWSAEAEDKVEEDDDGYNTAGLAAYYYYGSK